MPVAVYQSPEPRPGTWNRLPYVDGRPSNWVGYTCPQCGKTTLFDTQAGFSIEADGTLSPDFACSTEECSYAVPLRLKGWTDPAVSVSSPPTPSDPQRPTQDQP